jgi:E3 ubiquitin-protein ligase BOI-like protein
LAFHIYDAVGGGPSHVLQPQPAALNGTLFNSNEAQNELTCTLLGSRKRAREAATAAADVLANQRQQQQQLLNQQRQPQQQQQQEHQLLNVSDYRNHIPGPVVMPPQSTGVSTGLRLTFEDDRLNSTTCASTSGRGNVSSTMFSIMGEDLSTQIQQQSEEIELLLKAQVVCLFVFLSPSPLFLSFTELDVYIYTLPCLKRCAGLVSFVWNWCFLEADGKCWNPIQGEQVRQLLEEKRQRHSRALVAAIEEGIVRRFQEKDLEIENIKRQNEELAEHVKQLRMEAHRWEVKAKTNEAMVAALKSNLQQAHQAVALSREQSKEGCGDSEADDAASSHHGDDPHARTFQENRELREQRMCRVCRCNDVSILLLPCRHLCLCKECETRLDTCPLCRSLKNASVQVYMS